MTIAGASSRPARSALQLRGSAEGQRGPDDDRVAGAGGGEEVADGRPDVGRRQCAVRAGWRRHRDERDLGVGRHDVAHLERERPLGEPRRIASSSPGS